MSKPFASSADTDVKTDTLEILGDGVYALTAEGDPNVGAVEGEDFVVAIESRATPSATADWLKILREQTDKPIRYVILTHHHAVRVLGTPAFEAQDVIMSDEANRLVAERGEEDWKSEFGRMPRLAKNADEVKGLVWPTITFGTNMSIDLGGDRGKLDLRFLGRGHTSGDIAVWHEKTRTLFAGDLVESKAALYTGDAYHFDWSTGTLDNVKAYRSENLIGGRGAVSRGVAETDAAVEQTRKFLRGMIDNVGGVHKSGGDIKDAFEATREALAPEFGAWPIFEHCLPFDVQRLWDEHDGVEHPRIWTAERDREVWAKLQG
ncbi:glyoxylase-like metal-dependent hydrolase (beta-lactamase superfamily II) [Amaricoccus macauensis]|uniref:Glyoxylase-like metal-dependent hydrolase (Beta-lactamase superfamily II) n=1 Tax=Amaricoccus macauensis TaxID=57001 RepID=A0A840SH59_9RHOB|nr:MBL fold metallo-hydrolase [Amaricoccus macauensis]MBB5222339.1 glyoxylase-like metal-dependent hydrolase (beta-lactamase superfamily II) [Amaricoccus macauensis]